MVISMAAMENTATAFFSYTITLLVTRGGVTLYSLISIYFHYS